MIWKGSGTKWPCLLGTITALIWKLTKNTIRPGGLQTEIRTQDRQNTRQC
jgi:hypothetical protein